VATGEAAGTAMRAGETSSAELPPAAQPAGGPTPSGLIIPR
jgi:hypothetical protein